MPKTVTINSFTNARRNTFHPLAQQVLRFFAWLVAVKLVFDRDNVPSSLIPGSTNSLRTLNPITDFWKSTYFLHSRYTLTDSPLDPSIGDQHSQHTTDRQLLNFNPYPKTIIRNTYQNPDFQTNKLNKSIWLFSHKQESKNFWNYFHLI